MDRCSVADMIDRFLAGTSGDYEWDDFISIKQKDPEIEEVRLRCASVATEYPSQSATEYCSAEGRAVLGSYAYVLRSKTKNS